MRIALATLVLVTALVPQIAHAAPGHLLVFSKTAGFRHDSIAPAIASLQSIADAREWTITASEDAVVFTDGTLAQIDVVVFMMTTGDILDEAQQAAMQAFVEAGGGFVGIHSATDTEYDWPWYGELVGARFVDHPAPQDATVNVVAIDHPACAGLPAAWSRFDEWYNFSASPSATANVLLQLDETSYSGGTMGADHPIAWTREIGDARMFYSGGGHTDESWAEPLWIDHVANGIDWVLTDPPATGDTSTGDASSDGDGSSTIGDTTSSTATATNGAGTTETTSTTTSTGTSSDDTTGQAQDDDDSASGCGCHTRSRPSSLALLIPLLLLRHRTRWSEVPRSARKRRLT